MVNDGGKGRHTIVYKTQGEKGGRSCIRKQCENIIMLVRGEQTPHYVEHLSFVCVFGNRYRRIGSYFAEQMA